MPASSFRFGKNQSADFLRIISCGLRGSSSLKLTASPAQLLAHPFEPCIWWEFLRKTVGQEDSAKRKPVLTFSCASQFGFRCGGIGLNLTAANHVIHFDRCYNPAKEAQAGSLERYCFSGSFCHTEFLVFSDSCLQCGVSLTWARQQIAAIAWAKRSRCLGSCPRGPQKVELFWCWD